MIRYVWPQLPKLEEIKNKLKFALENGEISMCNQVKLFEEQIAAYLDVPYVLAMGSATAALILMLRNFQGDILVPSWTFHATLAACWWNKLNPIYVDIDPETWTIDVEDAEKKITPSTQAILAVNIFGLPPDIDDLTEFADAHKILLFFDSSQGIGSTYKGKLIGGNGEGEIFSLSATKIFTAGEGGLFTTNNVAMYNSMKNGRQWGDPGATSENNTYNPSNVGLNGHMTEFEAILGQWGLSKIDEIIDQRHILVNTYKHCLKDYVEYQKIPDDRTTTYKEFSILVPRDSHLRIKENLEKNNIQFKSYFFPCHMTNAYRKNVRLPITEDYSIRSLTLPMHYKLTEQDIEKICNIILEAL